MHLARGRHFRRPGSGGTSATWIGTQQRHLLQHQPPAVYLLAYCPLPVTSEHLPAVDITIASQYMYRRISRKSEWR